MLNNHKKLLAVIAIAAFYLVPTYAQAGTTKYVLKQGYLIDMQGPKGGYVLVYGHDNCVRNKFQWGTKVVQQADKTLRIVNNSGGQMARLDKPTRIINNPRPEKCAEKSLPEIALKDLPEVDSPVSYGEIEGLMARPIAE